MSSCVPVDLTWMSAAERRRILAERRAAFSHWIDSLKPCVPVYKEADAPSRPWPWNGTFFAETPANDPPNTPDFGGVGLGAGSEDFAAQKALERFRFHVAKRDKFQCQRCLKHLRKTQRSTHHIVPRDEGGATNLANLILLCHPCHDWVEIQEGPTLRTRKEIELSLE
jgi:hypothetical protein